MNFEKYGELSPIQKAALVLNVFGQPLASEIFKHMNPADVQAVSILMRQIRKVPASVVQQVVNDFKKDYLEYSEKSPSEVGSLKFQDIPFFEDHGLKLVLKEVSTEQLIIAMKTASEDIRDKIYRNISSRAISIFVEDSDDFTPAKLSEVESAQQEIIRVAERLRTSGTLRIGREFSNEVLT